MPRRYITPEPDVPLQEYKIDSWGLGEITSLPAGKTPPNSLIASHNTYLTREGGIAQRPSLTNYGDGRLPGKLVGILYKYEYLGNPYMVGCFNDDGNYKIAILQNETDGWKDVNIGNWTNTNNRPISFIKVEDKLLILGGDKNASAQNSIGVVDLTSNNLAIDIPKQISTPAKPRVTISSGNTPSDDDTPINWVFKVTAVTKYGETDPSPPVLAAVKLNRFKWDAINEVTLTLTAVTGALSYNIYAGLENMSLYLLANTTSTTFVDDGTKTIDVNQVVPFSNHTNLPDAKYGLLSEGRLILYGIGGKIHYSALEKYLRLRPGVDSGVTFTGEPDNEEVVFIGAFRNNEGVNGLTVLTTQGGAGDGSRYFMHPVSTQTADFLAFSYKVIKVNDVGSASHAGVVTYKDSLYYPTKKGFYTTGTKPNIQNLVMTESISQTIQDHINYLSYKYFPQISGVSWQERIYWTLTVGGETNNRIWIMDLTKNDGSWMLGWDMEVDYLFTYSNAVGLEELLVIKDNTIRKFTDEILKERFKWSAKSSLIFNPQSNIKTMNVGKVYFMVYNWEGNAVFNVYARTADGYDILVGSKRGGYSEEEVIRGGWGRQRWGQYGWGDAPASTSELKIPDPITYIWLDINEEVQWLYFVIHNDQDVFTNIHLGNFSFEYVSGDTTEFEQKPPTEDEDLIP